MSISAAEMARQDEEQVNSSKKRKHTDDERAERKKKKKQIHAPVGAEIAEAEDAPFVGKKREKRRSKGNESVPQPTSAQQDSVGDVELPNARQDIKLPDTEEMPPIPKKRKKRKDTATKIHSASPASEATKQQDIELPDASVELVENTFAIPSTFTNGISSTNRPTPPSDSTENTPFNTTRASLYVPCPAISISTVLPSLIATHLTPLLLTYYPPVAGVVLAITDVSISNVASNEAGKPLQLPQHESKNPQFALCADDSGVSFTWLTATFTTFCPTLNTALSGHINIASEGFIGLVLYNYFQVGIARSRIPKSWHWTPPGGTKPSKKQPKKGRIRDSESADHDSSQASLTTVPDSQPTLPGSQPAPTSTAAATASAHSSTGHWTRPDGTPVTEGSGPLTFRVVDVDAVPTAARDAPTRLGLQIEGTLLPAADEAALQHEERVKFERAQNKALGRAAGAAVAAAAAASVSVSASRSRDHDA